MLILLSGCLGVPHDSDSEVVERTCDVVLDELNAEYASIATCDDFSDCGQVLTGTSCGCTRNWVARNDADGTAFYALQGEAGEKECAFGTSVCDCPAAYGFECEAGTCSWDYDEGSWLPDCQADHGATTTIEGISVGNDELLVAVGYGGGCEDHVFTLCWPDQSFMESDPVQVTLELFHEDNDDACDMWIEEEISLDLAPLRQAWTEAYGSEHGSIVLHLGGFDASFDF